MRLKDLVINKTYYWDKQPLIYLGEHRDWSNSLYLRFKDEDGRESCFSLWRLAELTTEPTGEKTMPVPRKPEQITLELTQDEIIKALSSLGYDLKDYTLGYTFGRDTFQTGFVLKLKKGFENEKTKATT
jgi:hypothetical protein